MPSEHMARHGKLDLSSFAFVLRQSDMLISMIGNCLNRSNECVEASQTIIFVESQANDNLAR